MFVSKSGRITLQVRVKIAVLKPCPPGKTRELIHGMYHVIAFAVSVEQILLFIDAH